jgi:hypothetical protein
MRVESSLEVVKKTRTCLFCGKVEHDSKLRGGAVRQMFSSLTRGRSGVAEKTP